MSYDFCVWEGPAPEDDEAARAFFSEWVERDEAREDAGEPPAPATPAIAAFVEAVLQRFPDSDEDLTWSAGLSVEDADGPVVYLAMTYSAAESAVPVIADLAHERGLVCFDPQGERLVRPGDLEQPSA